VYRNDNKTLWRDKMPKLQEVKGRFFITVPSALVKQKTWIKHQELFFVFNERGNIELTDTMVKK
jgi:hypothetical protein